MVRKESLAVIPVAVCAAPLTKVTSPAPGRNSYVVATCLSLELPYITGKRGGLRPPWVERRFRARLRGKIINMKKFRFVTHWGRSTRKNCEKKNKGANARPNRASKNPSKSVPLLLLPPLQNVVPDCVLQKFNSKKRLSSDAKMALETFQVEAMRLVELSGEDKADDLRRMRGEIRLPRNNPPKRALETDLARRRGCVRGEKMKRLKYKVKEELSGGG